MDRTGVMMAAMDAETETGFLSLATEIPRDDLWLLSDFALLHEQLFNGSPAALANSLGISDKTVLSWQHTARVFPLEKRTWNLSYSHYRVAAYSNEPVEWLNRADKEGIKMAGLRRAIRDTEGRKAPRGKSACSVK